MQVCFRFREGLEVVHRGPGPSQGVVVVLILPALVLEAGIEDLLDLLGYHRDRLFLPDVDPEPVVGPAYLQDVVVGPERLQWGPDSGLDLEVVRHVLVLDDAEETSGGENPHQTAIFYSDIFSSAPSVSDAVQIQGKQLSYNNLLDFDSALSIVTEFDELTAVVVKHNNPCGAASSNNLEEAYDLAINTDPQSSFGGIISFNGEVSEILAKKVVSSFKEGIIAPSFTRDALEILSAKENLRVLETGSLDNYQRNPTLRSLDKGWLLQESDEAMINIADCNVVTQRKPSSDELESLYFAWKIVKHVKSNAIDFARNKYTVGIGAGQMSRIDSVKIAEFKSIPNAKGCVMASDAFFPFRDGIDEAVKAGITAVIQPGGSMRDQEVIDAANEQNIAMVFTGMRHFKH